MDAFSDHVCQPQIPRGHHRIQRLREIGQNMERGGNEIQYTCVDDCVVTCPCADRLLLEIPEDRKQRQESGLQLYKVTSLSRHKSSFNN